MTFGTAHVRRGTIAPTGTVMQSLARHHTTTLMHTNTNIVWRAHRLRLHRATHRATHRPKHRQLHLRPVHRATRPPKHRPVHQARRPPRPRPTHPQLVHPPSRLQTCSAAVAHHHRPHHHLASVAASVAVAVFPALASVDPMPSQPSRPRMATALTPIRRCSSRRRTPIPISMKALVWTGTGIYSAVASAGSSASTMRRTMTVSWTCGLVSIHCNNCVR